MISAAGLDCARCHRAHVEAFAGTAHRNASREASAESIAGSFEPGRNVMLTRREGTWFQM